MMSALLNEAATVRDLLFTETAEAPADALAVSLREHDTLGRLLPAGPVRSAAEREIAAAIDKLLSLSLADVLAAGWQKYEALQQAARRTRDAPGTEEVVVLATHHIDSVHRPRVELHIDGTPYSIVELTVRIGFTVTGALAVVRQGRLVEIRTGSATVTGSLGVAGFDTMQKRCSLDLPGAIRRRGGIALLEASAPAAAHGCDSAITERLGRSPLTTASSMPAEQGGAHR